MKSSARDAISALCILETFSDTFETSSDFEGMHENMDNTSCNIEKVMGNSQKDAEQDKTKSLTS